MRFVIFVGYHCIKLFWFGNVILREILLSFTNTRIHLNALYVCRIWLDNKSTVNWLVSVVLIGNPSHLSCTYSGLENV